MKSTKALIVLFVVVPGIAIAATKSEIKSAIETKYELTTRSVFSGQVKKPGTVLYVSRSGLQANKPSTFLKGTIIKDGELEQLGGGSLIPGDAGKTLNVGEEMYLYRYQVSKEGVVVFLGTVESYSMEVGNKTKMQPYQLALQFTYSEGVAAIETKRLLDDIARYFSTDREVVASDDRTLKLGQTLSQVVEILGPPNRKVDLGDKQIYTYDDLKITFENGVVANVE
jgi:ribosomal protein L23